jgi:hypothetical protein
MALQKGGLDIEGPFEWPPLLRDLTDFSCQTSEGAFMLYEVPPRTIDDPVDRL